jgi:TRAP-type C4-dicarboxylate transport system substrate-binding protein
MEASASCTLTGRLSFDPLRSSRGCRPPAPSRTQIEQIAREVQHWAYDSAEKGDVEILDKLKKSGINVNVANRDAFVAASKPVYERFGAEVPACKKLIDETLALAK